MRKLFLFMMISLDGYMEGENHDLSWHNVDSEFNSFAINQTKSVGALLFGRKTYELMRDFWPTETARTTDPIVARLMNEKQKIVFSRSLAKVEETQYWKNVRLVQNNSIEEIRKLKLENGKDLAVYGSNNFCVTLLENDLLDELRIMVNPVIIGKGTPLFAGIKHRKKFRLAASQTFQNGNILLTYEIAKEVRK